MPVDWPFAENLLQLGGTGHQKIAAEDGARQQATARAILSGLARQPGAILADEVGMGKTYVALAVVASAALATRRDGRPVVVMVPPSLTQKWPREWEQFKAVCCSRPEALAWVRAAYAHTPTEFFRCLDLPRDRRPHIIWMATTCLWRGLNDPWVKLALIRLARRYTKLSDSMKGRLFKWASSLVRLKSWGLEYEQVEWLLSHEPSKWHRYLKRCGLLDQDSDDPIPAELLRRAREIDFGDESKDAPGLATLLHDGTIPGKGGRVSAATEAEARSWINAACQAAYRRWIKLSRWRSPLLVLDEAHHAKNDETRLASLFRSEGTEQLVEVKEGATERELPMLWEKFDRMLFLTATPFQLGHHELIRVLRSFAAAKWSGPAAPDATRPDFLTAVSELEKRLDENQLAGRRLDRLWGRLAPLVIRDPGPSEGRAQAVTAWWGQVRAGSTDPLERELLSAVDECRRTKGHAERDGDRPWTALQTWVIRHNRPESLPAANGVDPVPRRILRSGEGVAEAGEESMASGSGLAIAGNAALPFLLAARAQGEFAHASAKGRAYFAEGLCSSYEAFHHTREHRGDTRDVDDNGVERTTSRRRQPRVDSLVPVVWYEEQVERLVPSKAAADIDRFRHPKLAPVVERVVSLWTAGEKVVVFCFYRETAKALRFHVGRKVEEVILRLAAEKLGLDPERDAPRLRDWFARVGRRLADADSPFHEVIDQTLREPIRAAEFSRLHSREDQLVDLLAAYVRSPSFIARYLPLDVPEVREALFSGSTRPAIVRAGAGALARALTERADASAMSMRRRVEEFLRFARELAERGQPDASVDGQKSGDPLAEYLDAVAVYVKPRKAGEDDDEEAAPSVDEGTYRVLPTVRLAFGDTKAEVRERLMLAFNSPLFPEVLVSSAVLAEGVDLHRFCRFVIHHDLCWNPSTLEQRTGRLDRIRCKAEVSGRPIVIYEPFLAGSADEKMFRVVRDRERWFQIVMGQKFEFDEAATEELANRVPLPADLAAELVFDLRRYRPA
jgi:hypothetical protein